MSISEEYYCYCETSTSNVAIEIAHNLRYLFVMYYSLSRCRQLPSLQNNNNQGPKLEAHIVASQMTPSLNADNTDRPNDGKKGRGTHSSPT